MNGRDAGADFRKPSVGCTVRKTFFETKRRAQGAMAMQITARLQYSCLALAELANRQNTKRPVTLKEITATHAIPQPFLVQILQQLKSLGWVSSIRGAQGGYRLAISPHDLTVLEIVEQVAGSESLGAIETVQTPAAQAVHEIWFDAIAAFRDKLAQVKLSDLAERCAKTPESMFYI